MPGFTPDFWYRPDATWASRLLAPLGWLYSAFTAARMARGGAKANLPVICIGNVTAGGAGKTPTTAALAALLSARGETPFIVSRGYGGSLSGPVLVDPAIHSAADVGDEPLMLAQDHKVIIARHRPDGAHLAKALGASLVLLDDGLQNPALHKDCSIAVFDGAVGIGNARCVPAGPLRAPMAAQWPRVDLVIIIGDGVAGQEIAAEARTMGKPVFTATLEPEPAMASHLSGQKVLALAGLGRPAKFAATLQQLGAEVAETAFFPDHHPYSAADVSRVAAQAKALNLPVVTTQKDMMRLAGLWQTDRHGMLVILPVSLAITDAREFLTEVMQRARPG
jgi:tetraacyldisaccharide 4'-kinase